MAIIFSKKFEPVIWIICFLCVFLFVIVPGYEKIIGLTYPTYEDQKSYLLAGNTFINKFIFLERAPIYSAWVGIVNFFCHYNIEQTFYLEKILSIMIFSILIFITGWYLVGKWTSLFLAAWIWNCKYLLLEINGSHAFAVIFMMAAWLLLLNKRTKWSIPLAIAMCFFSAWCRSEMFIVYGGAAIFWVLYKFKKSSLNFGEFKNRIVKVFAIKNSVLVFSAVLALFILFKSRTFGPEPGRFEGAFMQNFCVGYAEGNNLENIYQDKWGDWPTILKDNFPKAQSAFGLIKYYPLQVKAHFVRNLKLLIPGFPATVFGLLSRERFLICFIFWTICFIAYEWRVKFSPDILLINQPLIILFTSTFLLIPISIVFRSAMRYYEALVPVNMLLFVAIIFLGTNYAFPKLRTVKETYNGLYNKS